MRFFVLGIQHTRSSRHDLSCAFTQKVVKLCEMLKGLGHYVVHLGNEGSNVVCDEHVQMCSEADLATQYGERWMTDQYSFNIEDPVYTKFDAIAIGEITKRKQPLDFLLCMWGAGHRRIADQHKDMIIVEPGIGYAGGHFAPYKVFESYAILHAYLGMTAVANATMNGHWYDVVIPNYLKPGDFKFTDGKDKEDYFLFLGRVGGGKGIDLACQVATETGVRLVIAGPGTRDNVPDPYKDSFIGFADHDKRKQLLSKARGLIMPTMYVEPFGGVQIEALMSGTPAITTDWGAFTENNLHGITGYRCRTFDQFCWAVKNIDKINSRTCRDWAEVNFSLSRCSEMYSEYFQMVFDVHSFKSEKGGWYEGHPERTQLDWLRKIYP